MKKYCLCLLILLLCLSGCAANVPEAPGATPAPESAAGELVVYCSFPPVYEICRPVAEGVPGLTLRCLAQPQDDCLRSYALSAWDAARLLSGADALVMGGRGLESFESYFSEGESPFALVSLMDGMELISHGEATEEADDHFAGDSPYAFLSAAGAEEMARAFAGAMAQLDPGNAELYEANFSRLALRLDALKKELAALQTAGAPAAVLNEGLIYAAEELRLKTVYTLKREIGAELSGEDLARAAEEIKKSGAQIALIEDGAPQRLRDDLAATGIELIALDMLSASPGGEARDFVERIGNNARRVAAAVGAGK